MIRLPLLDSLDVADYGLYPGTDQTEGLHVRFDPGLTLFLGTNGLGKTTMVLILYRLLTGPWDIPALRNPADLGNARLDVRRLRGPRRRLFAQRVADGGAKATARLTMSIGGETVAIERRLSDLRLQSFSIGNRDLSPDEDTYQTTISEMSGVSNFSDWILLLRFIVFYFEDRRSLVWDPTAQRQLLRILFLDTEHSNQWTAHARDILEADTRLRNLIAVTNREQSAIDYFDAQRVDEETTRLELNELEERQRDDSDALEQMSAILLELDSQREQLRLRYLTVEQHHESQCRELERAKLISIDARLPQYSDSARYILTQLITGSGCVVCGHDASEARGMMERRIQEDQCLVCGSALDASASPLPTALADGRVDRSAEAVDRIETELNAARLSLEEAEVEYRKAVATTQQLRSAIAQRTARIDSLVAGLPPEETLVHERRQDLAGLRANLDAQRQDLRKMRESFAGIVTQANATVIEKAELVQGSFEDYAKDFLFEDCSLTWSPQRAQLGEGGQRYDFPAFGLELGGSDFSRTVRRHGPDEVSESQRQFIDLSFRMALAKIAGQQGLTTLVMDAPEASLDAVFVSRAAQVLAKFGRATTDNRLIVTSNLTDSRLVPELFRQATDHVDWHERVVDLFEIAAPTAAVRTYKEEYETARRELLEPVRNRT